MQKALALSAALSAIAASSTASTSNDEITTSSNGSWQAGPARACVAPDLGKLLDVDPREVAGFVEARLRTFQLGPQKFQWLAVSTSGPPTGAIYLLNCDGRRLDDLPLGAVVRMSPGPLVHGAPSLEVYFVPDSGTGYWAQSVALLQIQDSAIRKLWTHSSFEITNDAETGLDDVYRFGWQFSPTASQIRVTGTEITGRVADYSTGRATGQLRHLPAEVYCLPSNGIEFAKCD